MTSQIANNPLAKHFRQPAIYLKLPSSGQFYPEGTVELTVSGEVPIYPMTIKDELSLKTPDALMNGEGLAQIIRSCCPSIKDPWIVPAIDLDPLLIAIRLASYGPEMDIASDCPHCGTTNDHTVDLRKLLDAVPPVSGYGQSFAINGLVFEFHPQTYNDINRIQQINFEQQKILNIIAETDLSDEDRVNAFKESFDRLTSLNLDSLVSCIASITTEDGQQVTQSALIKDFLTNTDRQTYDAIKEQIQSVVSSNAMRAVDLQCNECTKLYKTNLEFNQSNFFG